MKVGLIHYTEDYHKLCETVARVCYQSYHKDGEDSHNFIKAIMSKGHLSISSVGNIVFGVAGFNSIDEYAGLVSDLHTMKEINPFVKTTMPDAKKNPEAKIGIIVSMNMLAFLEIYQKIDEYDMGTNVWNLMVKLTDSIPELRWFYDKGIVLPNKNNKYTAKGTPNLYEPIILEEDYTILKEKGLTDYELDVHASVTVNFMTDRSAGLQLWRHWAGGCELSQRYVARGNAEFRELVDLDKQLDYLVSTGTSREDADALKVALLKHNEETIEQYEALLEHCKKIGIRGGRAKEIARSILPNNITTQIIQNRPLRNWKHLFHLRDSSHAQKEVQADVVEIKKAFTEVGIPVE